MEKKNLNMEEQSFFTVPQRVKAERMEKLFNRAVGDELVEKREEMVKHFDMGANRYQAVIYSEPVHFRESEDQDWQEIDNTLEETVNEQGRRVLRNRANRMHVEFPQEMDGGNMAAITDGGKTFAWCFEEEAQPIRAKIRTGAQLKHERLVKQAQKLPKYVGRTVESLQAADLETEMESEQERRGDIAKLRAENSYADVLPGVSVRYTLGSEKVKEDIILADAAALKHAKLRLPKGFDYEVTEGKQLLIKDKANGKIVFTMDTPFVYDAAGKETIADVVLTDCGEYIRLEYVLDAEFMAEAQFPVTIDPTINSTNAVTNIQDTTLGEGQSAKPYTADHLKIGKLGGSVRCVGLLKFNSLAVVPASDTVISAVLQMCPKDAPVSNYIGAYEVKKYWEAASTNWASLDPDDEANIATDALECSAGSTTNWLAFDLTNLYRKWCTRDASGNSNNGVAFRTPDNITGNNYSELYSSDASSAYRPVMYVNYISHAGLEGWWQYEQMSAGRAGTVHADLFNGNMVLEHSDTVMTGNRMPVSVNHFYNSCLSSANSYNCGYGWKTDAHQKITARTHNSRNYFVWEDGDGTEHFFEKTDSQPYKDCEGMDLEMTYTTGSPDYIIITDKEHNQMRFNVVKAGLAWLVAARDAMHNTVVYSYVTGKEEEGRIDYITDPVQRKTQFKYTSDLLSEIQIPAASGTRSIYFTYDSSSRLTGVRYGELGGTAAHTTYGYDGTTKLLTKARNYDGIQLNIGYEALSLYGSSATDQARHITSLETVATNSSGTVTKYGAKQVFEYGAMTTTVTAVENTSSDAGKKLYYQFNDSGNVICVRDDLGFARFTKFDSNFENKESEISKLRKAVVNRLRKSDFNSQWTAVAAGGTATKDTSTLCLNTPSVKMAKTGSGEVIYRQQVALEAGTPFTLSAYMKATSLSGGGAFLRIKPVTSGAFTAVTSEVITGSTAAAVGNELPTDGWERIRVTLDALTAATNVYVELVCNATSGTAWFSCPQLETGVVANTFNLVSNGDFRYTTTSGSQTLPLDWDQGANNLTTANTGVFNRSTDSTFPEALEGNYVQVEGRPDKSLIGFVQYYDMIGKAGDIFVVGGWADGKSIPNANTRDKGFTLALSLKKASDGSWINPAVYPFNDEWVGWQQNCYAAAAGADYTQIALFILYTGNCNKAKFSNIFLHREAYGTSFGRDSEGNVLSISNLAGQKSDIKYDSADNIKIYTQPGRDSSVADNQYWFYYGDEAADEKQHLLWRSRTPMHMTDYYEHDDYGNTIASRRVDYRVFQNKTEDNAYPYIRTETDYADGNYTFKTRDARNNEVVQVVNTNDGTVTSETDPTNQTVMYTYDASKRVTAVQSEERDEEGNLVKAYRNDYTYENDRIKTVSHNTTSDTSSDVTYTFGYDELGRKTTVKVGTQILSTNVYENERNGLLSEVQYGNGGKVAYTYDEFDRLTAVQYDGEATDRYTYRYGANGAAAEITDNELGRMTRTDYDLANRPCQTELVDNATGEVLYKTGLKYDKLNNLTMFSEQVDGEVHKSEYTYDRDNRITQIAFDGGTHKVGYTYDELGRVATLVAECGADTGKVTTTYGYVAGGYGTNSTTPLVASITQKGVNFTYEYDSRGNIISETRGNEEAGYLTTGYVYDALGQLVRVNDPHENATWVYNYDRGGNITSKVRYAYTTGSLGAALESIPYAYSDTNWKDKLTAYNGRSFAYDAIGNPLNDGVWTYEWEAGRKLKAMSAEGTVLTFKYDHNGLRTQKVVQQDWYPVTTNYTLYGKLISYMTVDYVDWDEVEQHDVLRFFYDAQSRPAKVNFNSSIYTYVRNMQGDIVGILDNEGNLVVEYKYDAWGRLLEMSGNMADSLGKRNPFRYRGYVYDEESGLYYLKNRYYMSEIGRFISLDEFLAGATGEVLNHNAYIYCGNNPIAREDEDGDWFVSCLIGAAVSLAFEYVNDVVENFQDGKRGLDAFIPDSPPSDYIAAGVGGFIAAIPGGTYVKTAVVGAVSNVVDKTIRGDIKSVSDLTEAAMVGGYSNAVGRYVSEYIIAGRALKRINKQNRATRKAYARKVYGGKNKNINTNLKRLAVEPGPAYADSRKYRYGAYSSITSTGIVNYVLAY